MPYPSTPVDVTSSMDAIIHALAAGHANALRRQEIMQRQREFSQEQARLAQLDQERQLNVEADNARADAALKLRQDQDAAQANSSAALGSMISTLYSNPQEPQSLGHGTPWADAEPYQPMQDPRDRTEAFGRDFGQWLSRMQPHDQAKALEIYRAQAEQIKKTSAGQAALHFMNLGLKSSKLIGDDEIAAAMDLLKTLSEYDPASAMTAYKQLNAAFADRRQQANQQRLAQGLYAPADGVGPVNQPAVDAAAAMAPDDLSALYRQKVAAQLGIAPTAGGRMGQIPMDPQAKAQALQQAFPTLKPERALALAQLEEAGWKLDMPEVSVGAGGDPRQIEKGLRLEYDDAMRDAEKWLKLSSDVTNKDRAEAAKKLPIAEQRILNAKERLAAHYAGEALPPRLIPPDHTGINQSAPLVINGTETTLENSGFSESDLIQAGQIARSEFVKQNGRQPTRSDTETLIRMQDAILERMKKSRPR